MDFQVIIVGAGPAGIFTALTLADLGIGSVLLLEKGKDLEQRSRLKPEDMLCGWGGAGAFSDGKLMLSPELGGFLGEFLDRETLNQLLRKADEVFVAHGASNRIFGETSQKVEALGNRARLAGLELVPTPKNMLWRKS
ncbi:MAG: FAD-dependent monooxygenase [Deltaproteobacteria bacterium]|nr:FAD-dependent monooxygenase [Deltaproteobacteria bacterium]